MYNYIFMKTTNLKCAWHVMDGFSQSITAVMIGYPALNTIYELKLVDD